jgi:hypothetical protein
LQQQCFSSGAFSRQIFGLNFVKNYKLRRIRERITPSTKQAPDYSTLGGPVAEATPLDSCITDRVGRVGLFKSFPVDLLTEIN